MKRAGPIAVLSLVAALAWVIAHQPRDDGFRPGHRGWVTSHTLAVAKKATAANGFVGYAISLATPERRDLYYFDRYPVFFSAGLHATQELFADDRAGEIRVARQVMNLLYAATLAAGALLLVRLGLPVEQAVAAAALAGAGYTMTEWRDMVHFDQPALAGIVVLLAAIAAHSAGTTSSRAVLAAAAAAVLAGRGYASLAVLGCWWFLESSHALLPARDGATWRRVATGTPARAFALAVGLAAACLGWNVVQEARLRDVGLAEVSIVRSARQRLALDAGFNERGARRLTWGRFLANEQARLARSVLPWSPEDPLRRPRAARALAAAAVAAGALGFALTRDPGLRVVALAAAACGPAWLVAMRNLSAFHPYTAVYYFPLVLLFFASLVRFVPTRLGAAVAVAACLLVVVSNGARDRLLERDTRAAQLDTRDMDRIARVLAPGDAVATDHQPFPGAPFALGFYLPEQDVLVEGAAWLVLSRRAQLRGENLTPDNSRLFLHRQAAPWRARSSLARLHRDSEVAERRQQRRESRERRGGAGR